VRIQRTIAWAAGLALMAAGAGCAGGRAVRLEQAHLFSATGTAVLEPVGEAASGRAVDCEAVVEGEGLGFAAPDARTELEARLTALEAARAQAMAVLVEKLFGAQVYRRAEVRDLRFASAETRVDLSGSLSGVMLVDGDYDAEERMARVVLRVGLDANGRILPERLLHGTPRGAPPSEGMRRAQAEEAARCDAVAKLREQLGGAYITNEVTVEGLMLAHQRARSTVAGLMAGGVEYGKPVWPTPERCEVRAVLRLTGEDLRRLRSLVEPTR